MSHPSIAIVGAGPAGLTAARILQRHGWRAAVFEADASPDARDQGGTLDLHADAGQRALARAGLLDAFLACARHEDQDTLVLDHRTAATLAAERPAPGEGRRPEIDRKVLRDLLLDALAPDTVRWGHRLRDIGLDPDGRRRLHFDGQPSQAFDLVVGADGAWSRVRRALTGVQPDDTGIVFVELRIDDVDTQHPRLARLVGRGTMFALHGGQGLIAQRNGGGQLRIYAALPAAAPAGITRAWLLERFTGWAPALLALVTQADAIAAVRPIVALPPGTGWPSAMGLTLVGDAAHVMPPVGVGVNLAMLDAADLAEALVAAPDWRRAVQDFERAMLARAGAVAEEARLGFAAMFGPDAPRALLEHMGMDARAAA